MSDADLLIETVTDTALADEIAAVAAVTFPLACPPHSKPEDVAAHVAKSLSAQHFSEWIVDDVHEVIVAREGSGGPVVGYALLVHDTPHDHDVRTALESADVDPDTTPLTEVSKMYVLPGHHGAAQPAPAQPPSHLLMTAALDAARRHGSTTVWLGVNQENARALRYYGKMGYTRAGTKTFELNGVTEHDYVLVQPLT